MQELSSPAQAAIEPSPYLTIAQVTKRLHISKVTLWSLRRKGAIRSFSVGRRVLFKANDVTALVEQDPETNLQST